MTMPTIALAPAQSGRLQAGIFLALGLILGLLLVATKDNLYQLQGGTANVAALLPFGYAYGAGMVAAVNPCGILLMPSLVAYYLGTEMGGQASWRTRAGKAFLMGAMATLGFVALFAVVGFGFAAGGRALGSYFPIGGLAIGVLLAALGIWLCLSGRSFGLAGAGQAMGGVALRSDPRSLFLFGVAYGVASLACTLPIFLVVVGTTLAASGLLPATAQFVAYALGMGSMLTAVIVGAAFFRGAVARSLRGVVPYLHRLAASLLLGAGIFIIHYWLTSGAL